MKVMVIVKATKNSEAGEMPSQELLAEMGRFNEELARAGVLLAAEGLKASSKGARVRFVGKDRVVTDGPFTETKELVAGYWLWKVKSLQDAIDWVKRCPNPMPEMEGEIEIRPVFEPEDFSPCQTPDVKEQEKRRNNPLRFISVYKAKERGEPPTPEAIAAMGKLCEDMAKAGVLLATEGCLPSALGARIRRAGDKITVTDGPFTETNEVVAGFALLQATSKQDAIEQTKRFLRVAGDGECELRQVFDQSAFSEQLKSCH
jgi:hypothetical protein